MIPELSFPTVPGQLKAPYRTPKEPLVDFEYGGIDLNDASQGLSARLWKVYKEGTTVKAAAGVLVRTLFLMSNVTALALAFDQNARPFVAYLADGLLGFWWYDPNVGEMTFTTLGAGYATPMCCLDDRRPSQSSNSDIILSYIRDHTLCCRVQRERYAVEHSLRGGIVSGGLARFGPTDKLRLQWDIG